MSAPRARATNATLPSRQPSDDTIRQNTYSICTYTYRTPTASLTIHARTWFYHPPRHAAMLHGATNYM
eukprot:1182302-Prorocentrum_minimum.AAC.3